MASMRGDARRRPTGRGLAFGAQGAAIGIGARHVRPASAGVARPPGTPGARLRFLGAGGAAPGMGGGTP